VLLGASLAAAFHWRLPFYVIGAVGVVTALAVYVLVAEPQRGAHNAATDAPPAEVAAPGFFATI